MDNIPVWLQAGWWGLVAGGALLVGALVGYRLAVPQRLIAAIDNANAKRTQAILAWMEYQRQKDKAAQQAED